jgi:phage-related protein
MYAYIKLGIDLVTKHAPKPLIWIGDSLQKIKSFPAAVKDEIGFALYQAQTGNKHVKAKPLKGSAPEY